ncbi:MAG: hypothetical protein ACOZB3_09955 [Calditrichota bacterium]
MKKIAFVFIVAIGMVVWLAGCDADEGSALSNLPPSTALTVAPNDSATVNHYIPLRWAGNDPDGKVEGFWLFMDGDTLAYTTARDTTIAFGAPADGTPSPHTFSVIAVDNEGLSDTDNSATAISKRQRFFYVVNTAPAVSFLRPGTIADGATVGRGFRVTLDPVDANWSLMYYSVALDDSVAGWTEWGRDSIFLIADPSVIADTIVFPRSAHGVPNTSLSPGPHRLFARVKDAGDATSPVITLNFNVADGFRPVMNPTVTAQYGGSDLYPDGSAYHQVLSGTKTEIVFSATAIDYSGEISGYRHRLGEGPWSAWHREAAVDTSDLVAGVYPFQFMARDLAGEVTDPKLYTVRLVQQALSDSVIILNATAGGNGNPGSPADSTVNSFYARVLDGYKVRAINYADTSRGATRYVSPYDLQNAGLMVWHGDDRGAKVFNDNLPMIRAFLNKGGRLVLSGWDVMRSFADADTITFAAGSFGREQLRLFDAYRNRTRTTMGFQGVNGFAGCTIDSTKLPATWHGLADRCWVFRPRGECIVIGSLTVSDPQTNPIAGGNAVYIYDLSYRVAVFGVPLFFCYEDQVYTMFHGNSEYNGLIPHMLQGLSSTF